jgi:CRP-like cAMP-binding protein
MSQVVLKGDLKYINLGDLIQLIGSNASTGILSIKSQYTQDIGELHIIKGNIVDASSGSQTGLEAVYSLFGWVDGEFEFGLQPIDTENVVKKTRMEIVLDGLRMLDDGEIEKLGPQTQLPSGANVKKSDASSDTPLIKGPLVDYSYVVDEEEFFDGEEIVLEGKHGSWIWVILEGIIEIVKQTDRGKMKIIRIGEGAFLGSVASLEGDNVRSATSTAIGHVQLGVLDAQRLTSEFAKFSPIFRGLVLNLDKRLRQVTDSAVNIYLQKNHLAEFVRGKKPIIKQGDEEQRVFMIKQGEAAIIRKTPHGFVPLSNLTQGDYLGHFPFLDVGHEPHSASVLASKNLQLKAINRDLLQQEHDRLNTTMKNLIAHLATSVSVTSRLACDLQKNITQKKSPASLKDLAG